MTNAYAGRVSASPPSQVPKQGQGDDARAARLGSRYLCMSSGIVIAISVVSEVVGLAVLNSAVDDLEGMLTTVALTDGRWFDGKVMFLVSFVIAAAGLALGAGAIAIGGVSRAMRPALLPMLLGTSGLAILFVGAFLSADASTLWADALRPRYVSSREFAPYFSAAWLALTIRSAGFIVMLVGIGAGPLRVRASPNP